MKSKFFSALWNIRVEIAMVILALAILVAAVPIGTYLYFARDLQSKESIMNSNNTGLILTDRNDKPFYTFYSAKYRERIPLDEIPKVLQWAVIAAEDKDFYQHPGFSIKGIVRSIVLDVQHRELAFGGSTITQQLVKNVLLNSNKNFLRKYQEIVLAQEIERRFTKAEILEMYLNSVYFGEGAFGVEQASRKYFGKEAADLTLAEAALLAGILPAPSQYSPLSGDKEAAKRRQEYVLQNMQQQGYITRTARETALVQDLVYKSEEEQLNNIGTHFALLVRDELVKKYGEERVSRSGFRVKTTLHSEWQQFAEKTVVDQVERLQYNDVSNGAAVAIDPKSGEVLVLVGSKDWYNESYGKVNVALANRSPGSSFKPIIYAAALEKQLITPATPLHDQPTTFEGNYKPQNYDRSFRGVVLARRALANSLNVPAVEVMAKVGIPSGLEMAKRLGITTLKDPSSYGLSLVLGTGEVKLLELTNAYAVFANGGNKYPVTTILSIRDKRDAEIYRYVPAPQKVLDATVAFLISSILSDNIARAEVFGSALTISRPAAVKTGTAENYRDALTVGYTPSIAVGVWVGNNDNTPMDQVAGSLGAAPIWRSLMEHFTRGTSIERFTLPSGITQRSICSYNGLLVKEATSSAKVEYFLPGTEPKRFCFFGHTNNPRPTISPTVRPQATPEEKDEPEPTEKSEEPESSPVPSITFPIPSQIPITGLPGQ